MAACHCLVACNNYVATIPFQYRVIPVTKTPVPSVKRPLFTKLYNNSQRKTPSLFTGFYIGDINPYKQPNQKRSVAIQLSVVAVQGVVVDPWSTEQTQTLKFAPCKSVCFCRPSNLLNCCRCSKGNGPVSMWPAVTQLQNKILYVLLIH